MAFASQPASNPLWICVWRNQPNVDATNVGNFQDKLIEIVRYLIGFGDNKLLLDEEIYGGFLLQ